MMAAGSCLGWLLLSAACILYLIPVASGQPAYVWSDHRWLNSEDRPVQVQSDTHSSFAVEFLKSYVGTESERLDRHIPAAETAVVFVGNELRLTDVSPASVVDDLSFEHLLKSTGVTAAYPVKLSDARSPREGDTVAEYLISARLSSSLQGMGNVVTVGACEAESTGLAAIGVESLQEYLVARKKDRRAGATDVVIVCTSPDEKSTRHDLLENEGKVLSETLSALRTSGTSYVALHTLGWKGQNFKQRRSLSEEAEYSTNAASNTSGNGTSAVCNELCRKRATLWESLFVFLLLLIILISGTCCMAGVNTPTRFETSKEA